MAPSAIDASPSSSSLKKHHKRDKTEPKKKRSRDDDEAAVVEETPRKLKKSKSEAYAIDSPDSSAAETPAEPTTTKTKKNIMDDVETQLQEVAIDEPSRERKKLKKHKKHHGDDETQEREEQDDAMDVDTPVKVSSSSSSKRDKSKKEKSKPAQEQDDDDAAEADASDNDAQEKKKKRKSKDKTARDKKTKKRIASPAPSDDAMDVDAHAQHAPKPAASESGPIVPFFTQTISLYLPFFPVGFDKPLTNMAAQHLDPLLNHYSPLLRGVLLSYSNLNLSDRPVKASTVHPPTDQTPAVLKSRDEYAVGFGWLTFDAHLFIPARGKWMEGTVQLQSEGHIGVVCWDKFNASIEAKRLPRGWKWIDLDKNADRGMFSHPPSLPSPNDSEEQEQQQPQQDEVSDALDGEELQVVEQMHTTGYWVDEHNRKVTSDKLRFRIKNFDVGLAGDYGYLSIEGTFLDDDAERALAAAERETERARRSRQNPGGFLRPLARRVPEFSMTKFGMDDEEEDEARRTVVYKGSRPGTPDD
ncbi:hypothetical protein B0T22DRAFT_387956 [Podospora appendiculata]|uniref:DNA-directed RNA polymerase subunit n=1 Tax=Podospora appendiculata TaxID=314037 RepID=A0AAE0WZF1_9PEZI|nr:hypothetical protein B0T22DRAFT_387956 [Podospora appendiculata]